MRYKLAIFTMRLWWFVQRVNSEKIDWFKKDEKVKYAAVKYRRIKEINTVRNDFIETLILKKWKYITNFKS